MKDGLRKFIRTARSNCGCYKWKAGAAAKFVIGVQQKLEGTHRAKPAALLKAAASLCEEHELPMPKGVTAALLDAGLSLDTAAHGHKPVLHALLEQHFPPPLLPT